jgi:tellurite resistance protein TerC
VVGALVLRGVFIATGAVILERFNWSVYLFGAILVVSAVRMARHQETEVHPDRNPLVRAVQRLIPVTDDYHAQRFFLRRAGRLVATPLLVVLVAVESADIVFAVDSIPAVFAVTDEPFLVFTSNAFAILGLRALYFLLAGMMHRFVHLKTGLAAVLGFVGAKMLLADVYHVPVWASLATIGVILGVAVGASLRAPTVSRPSVSPVCSATHSAAPAVPPRHSAVEL